MRKGIKMKKVFFNIVVDVLNDIKLAFGMKDPKEDSDDVYQYVSLIAYQNDIEKPLAETSLIIEPVDDKWTLYLCNNEIAEINLLGMSAKITRDFVGNVFASVLSPDFNSSFLIKEMIATDDVPF